MPPQVPALALWACVPRVVYLVPCLLLFRALVGDFTVENGPQA